MYKAVEGLSLNPNQVAYDVVLCVSEFKNVTMNRGTEKEYVIQNGNLVLKFEDTIPGFKKNDDDQFVDAEVKEYPVSTQAFIAFLQANNEDFAAWSCNFDLEKSYSDEFRATLKKMLLKATVRIIRTKLISGSVHEGKTLTRDMYLTAFKSITFSKKAGDKLAELADEW